MMDDIEARIEHALAEEEAEAEAFLSSTQLRGYYLTAVATAIASWTLMFNYGAFGTVFFHTLFVVWVMCTAIFCATIFLPRDERIIYGSSLYALLIPSLWVISLAAPVRNDGAWYDALLFVLVLLTVLSLPYSGYVLLLITQGEALRLPPRMLGALLGIVLVVGVLGYGVGRYHHLFLTCEQFAVAGEFVPENCRPGGG